MTFPSSFVSPPGSGPESQIEDYRKSRSRALQFCLFATGCSGIVAEFVLSTLATYLLGNATLQWTLIMSFMLFAMGLGSRWSRNFKTHLLDTFIVVEMLLSSLCALSAVLCFGLSIYMESREIVIYPLALAIGFLIGLEIPLATRINSGYQELRTNIASVLEMDYFGSLLGGLLFAFVFLPFLGFAYTPVLLGGINFLVALWLLVRFHGLTRFRKSLIISCLICSLVMGLAAFFSKSIILVSEQKKYRDVIVLSRQTRYQKIVMTRWRSHYWLYINGQEQFSTYDEERYHEPLVHPAMGLASGHGKILILGGGDGLALREVLKYRDVGSVTLVDLDSAMTRLAKNHPVLTGINHRSFHDPRVEVVNKDGALFLTRSPDLFNLVIIDLPDPDSMDLMHLYSASFYKTVKRHLARGGIMVTQATSPYFARDAFLCILKTVRSAGLSALPLHNQVPTLGEWGWVVAARQEDLSRKRLKDILLSLPLDAVPTRFLNRDAMEAMTLFGKGELDKSIMERLEINTETHPVLHTYYGRGSWGVY